QLGQDPQLSVLLAREAVRTTWDAQQPAVPQAVDALHQGLLLSQIRQTFTGHTDWVTDVQYSPDGQTLVTVSLDGTTRIWDPTSSQARRTLRTLPGKIWSVAWSPEGRLI